MLSTGLHFASESTGRIWSTYWPWITGRLKELTAMLKEEFEMAQQIIREDEKIEAHIEYHRTESLRNGYRENAFRR